MPPYLAIDPRVLLAASGNDLDLFRDLSQIFLDTAPAMFQRMQQASAAGAPHAFIAASHSLRGVTVLVGARELTACLLALEHAAGGACPAAAALTPAGALLDTVCAEVRHSIAAGPGVTS